MMKLSEFLDKLYLAERSKTLYIQGCFGAPMTPANKKRYSNNLQYNKNRAAMINACSTDTFGFDCICLVKGICWGWTGDVNKVYGGAVYKSNGVPDVGADGVVKLLKDLSTDFSTIQVGELVHMSGHVGVYVGNEEVIECTPKWSNNVQRTNLGNIGKTYGHYRIWKEHGKLPWIDYGQQEQKQPVYYTVVRGDTLSKIGKKFGLTLAQLLSMNPQITNPNKIYVGQKIRIK